MSIWEILNNKWSHLGKIKKIVEILEKISYHNPMKLEKILIIRKHEMFWNTSSLSYILFNKINRKHEMFWNPPKNDLIRACLRLTVNMKCFEIYVKDMGFITNIINRKHEMFWNFKRFK